MFKNEENQLHRAGEIQVEATSFTVSEPIEEYIIEPIVYKYATQSEKIVLVKEFDLIPFKIKVQKLERIFTDKIFAAEFYYKRKMYIDLTKHLYDLTILFSTKRIQSFLNNMEEFKEIVKYNREEENYRKGGMDKNIRITDFEIFNIEFNEEILKAFELMQNKYVFKDEYKITIEETKKVLNKIKNKISSYS